MPRDSHASPLLRRLKIAGYCGLASVALALFIAMCAILKDGVLDREATLQSDDATELHGSNDTAVAEPSRTPG
ncbi:hypothetical protein LIG30_3942 [Burkholderia sp. lig30]|jgi:hypothetical protein|uniref:hypothetical protein n=1 Tax=Burkholderia sp. lig30 TaxID=1192124 RepID=UPI00046118A8|nr:hypothetical protein [Burkholderia sp. lig30]KDB06676.1 hypothetical protein LIG30_3942 [Burkholderia sp. lig30]